MVEHSNKGASADSCSPALGVWPVSPIIVNELFEVLMVLKQDGVGILLVEQLVAKALSVADEVIVPAAGACGRQS